MQEKAMHQKLKLLAKENREKEMKIKELERAKKPTNFTVKSTEELIRNSESFLKYLLIADDSLYSIFYYAEENRVYIEKNLFRLKLETIFSKNISDNAMLDVISIINERNYIKLGFKLFLDDFRELEFKIEEKSFSGKWIFVNMLHEEEHNLIKDLKKIAKDLKRGKYE